MLRKSNGLLLVVMGLLASAAYEGILRLFHPVALAREGVHGSWLGVCIGLELLGLYLLGKARRQSAA